MHFGMKAHVGVDTAQGIVSQGLAHTLEVTTGYSMAETLLHGDEAAARDKDAVGPRRFVPFKRKNGCDTTPEQKRLNRMTAALRSAVEHPFRVLKRQFGCTNMASLGLFKNEQHLFRQFALVDLYLVRRLIVLAG